ncbi:MAG: hypothetical protein ABFD10_09025, partial [Prolixibacteraceae bacterium]
MSLFAESSDFSDNPVNNNIKLKPEEITVENCEESVEPLTRFESTVIENQAFRLKIETVNGLNPYSLYDKKNNVVLANDDYFYGFGRPLQVKSEIKELPDHISEFTFTGSTDSFIVTHTFKFPEDQLWFEESLVLKNISGKRIDLNLGQTGRCGFRSCIGRGESNRVISQNWRFYAVPFLINTASGKREEYLIKNMVNTTSFEIASEGWIMANNEAGTLMIKYSQDQMEYSVVNSYQSISVIGDSVEGSLIWGGTGIHNNIPETTADIRPNQTIRFGLTRYIPFTGQWEKGFSLFRNFMDGKGHRFADDFNPPVHWNEIYDNPHWWNAPDTPNKRARFYCLKDMEIEAAKAAAIGCEALYLDPGWDTRMGSTIWADDRLMSCRKFCNYMKSKYNLKVALHTPLANWNDESAYPRSARKPFLPGRSHLCSGAPRWWQTKLERLLKLASEGIVYFMFDGTNYTGPCQVKGHGHTVPYTVEEHVCNYSRLAQRVKEKYPDVLIEMHDQVLGPTTARFVPIYYTQNSGTFDAIWAFEYMWDPMNDLVSGRSKSLYYYNLAYNIPLYDHINLKTDNANALVFWWTASTCRYLGIGGRFGVKASPPSVEVQFAHLGIGEKNSPPPEIWQAQKKAMQTYLRLKPFFVRGDFYGIDELTHIHTLSSQNSSVI